jgi:hypothetical protein
MLVDIVVPGWVPFPYLAIAKDASGLIKAHDIALDKYDFDKFVGGPDFCSMRSNLNTTSMI